MITAKMLVRDAARTARCRGKDAARVVGRELEEPADDVAEPYRVIDKSPLAQRAPDHLHGLLEVLLGVGGGDGDPQADLCLAPRGR